MLGSSTGPADCRRAAALVLAAVFALGAEARAQSSDGRANLRSLQLVDYEHLPLQPLLPTLESLTLRRHSMPGLALAYYQPALIGGSQNVQDLEGTGLQAATLWLREGLEASPPGKPAGGALVVTREGRDELAVLSATPDVAEPLFHALFMARLHRRYEREPLFAEGLRRRALKAFGDPPSQPSEGQVEDLVAEYIMASASFASHLMVTANEIERAERRRAALGRTGLCPQWRRQVGLFAQWREAFDAAAFPVSTFARDGAERTRNVSREHRSWVLESMLAESGWRGLPEDHQRLCPGGAR